MSDGFDDPTVESDDLGHPDLIGLLARVSCHVYSGLMSADGDYTELFTGPGTELLLGPLPPDTDPTDAWHAAVHPDDWDAYVALGTEIAVNSTVSAEYRLVSRDGTVRWVLDQMWLRASRPDGSMVVDGVVTDITDLVNARAELQSTSALLTATVTSSPAALVVLDNEARVQLWNPAAEEMFGWSATEVMGETAPHVPSERRASLYRTLERLAAGEHVIEDEIRSDRDGTPRYVTVSSAAVRDTDGEVKGFLAVTQDISQRVEMENQLRQLAHSDPLTGLANRVLLTDRIDAAVSRPTRGASQLALLLLDLDGFKAVNDSFGHATGDELLVAVAGRLASCLRSDDVAARLGGDEFAVLLETRDDEEAVRVAERVLATLSAPYSLSRGQTVVTASIGVAYATTDRSTQDLLRDADVAMYMAKAEGKNRMVVFQPAMQERVAARLQLETELRRAVELGQFVLHYQPIVNLETARIVGVEALVRWMHPERGLLLPAEFISVAEDTGLIVPLGAWVLTQACAQAAEWQSEDANRLLSIAINLSPRQLKDPQLLDVVSTALAAAGLSPNALTIEITEELLIDDDALTRMRLVQLRGLGIRVAVDDFGTGYSSLAYLREFPLDVLKVDRSFVSPLAEDTRAASLVRSIIELANALDMDTVAEGVETAEQARLLTEFGCRVAQGYFFAEPQPARGIERVLNAEVERHH
jgi:diguanylate cyclase (GGDEF)-like protein/PAS domain S-box-containing protein